MSTEHKHEHSHLVEEVKHAKYLWLALSLTLCFLVIEVAGALWTNSLALLSDAAHMLTDASALGISLFAIRLTKKEADIRRTFGYYRFEILSATFNAILLLVVAMYILYEAYERFQMPVSIQTPGMFIIALMGLGINLISMRLLVKAKDASLNVKSAYLEVWSDMLGSLGVIIAAIVIYFTHWGWVDSFIAVGLGFWVLPRTWILLKETLNILLEGVPASINLEKLRATMDSVAGIANVHDLHVWAISSNKICLTAHVVVEPPFECEKVIGDLRALLKSTFDITHVTLQHETKKCFQEGDECRFH